MNPKLVAIIEHYAQTHGLNLPPHQIVSDMVASGPSGVEQLLGLMGVTVNSGDPQDNLQAQLGQSQREAGLGYATTQFPATEEASNSNLAGVGAGSKDPMSEFTQLLQGATSIGQGLTSSLTGALQPFTQIAQQIPQQGMQAMQAVMGVAGKAGAGGGAAAAGAVPEALGAAGGAAGEAAGLAGAGGGAGAGLGTTPASQLGPPPTPSAGTFPASSVTQPPVPAAPSDAAAGPRGGMGGMPMMPPGAMAGAGGAGSESKTETKRVVTPSVKNGAPVQGRIVAPPTAPEVVKRVAGKPVAARRILAPEQKPADEEDDPKL
ncbi:MAG TPA: hypothetical protein VMC78_05860 [Mycobacterium sp.]|nr:hypothetical protein [Mycobacterium sp.]